MQKHRPSVVYTYRGPRHAIPWNEIRHAIVGEFDRQSALSFTITCAETEQEKSAKTTLTPRQPMASFDPSKRPTLAEVAREANVSTTTVSRVINERWTVSAHIQRRVDAAIERLDYKPNEVARSLVRGKYQQDEADDAGADAPRPVNCAETAVPGNVRKFG